MAPLIVTECNSIGIKMTFPFMSMNLLTMHFSEFYISEPFGMFDKIISECSTHHLRISKALFNIANGCLLVKTLKMLSIPCML